jgi:hypothetical protein
MGPKKQDARQTEEEDEMKDHEVDIKTAAEGELEELARRTAEDCDGDEVEALNAWALEVDVLKSTSNPDGWRVEFLTGVGGPTTRWVVDSRTSDVATFTHSWGHPTTTVDVWGERAEQLTELARTLAEDFG